MIVAQSVPEWHDGAMGDLRAVAEAYRQARLEHDDHHEAQEAAEAAYRELHPDATDVTRAVVAAINQAVEERGPAWAYGRG